MNTLILYNNKKCIEISYDKDDIEDPSEDEKLKSWENVFCIDEVTDCWYVPKSTQATFWELKKEWVLKAEHFVLAIKNWLYHRLRRTY